MPMSVFSVESYEEFDDEDYDIQSVDLLSQFGYEQL